MLIRVYPSTEIENAVLYYDYDYDYSLPTVPFHVENESSIELPSLWYS